MATNVALGLLAVAGDLVEDGELRRALAGISIRIISRVVLAFFITELRGEVVK